MPHPSKTEGARLDFSEAMSYGDYLALDQVLSAQNLLTEDHNEMLFVIIHQTSELWMKLMLHELQEARENIRTTNLRPAFKMLARVSRILEQLLQSWSVLATLTPSEYSRFRPALGNSSGFQSYQYRMIEFALGNKNAIMVRPHAHREDLKAMVESELQQPSLYDEAIRLLARRGFPLDQECVERDWSQPYVHQESVQASWLQVYSDPERHWDLYELAEKLVDLEDSFRQWRFRHLTTVERVIGFKQGTGGTSGVKYLKKMLETVLFPELWQVRTSL
ncbi:MAG: tryptophan 2,3-dioxygenase [bacterium]|jgi:tryptophan 2,3-dioxygenase